VTTPAALLLQQPQWRQGFFLHICQVGGLAIIQKRNEPILARGQTGK